MPEAEAIAGFHVEGPHISSETGPRGAHPIEHIRPPDVNEFERWQEAAGGNIRIVTVSPEWDQTPEYVRALVRRGVIASVGHTKATAPQIEKAIDAGATMSTHLGNAAHPTLPKTQNYIWDQLAEDRLTASFIVDGIHIPGPFFRAAVRAKGAERSVLVTDAVMPAMCQPGAYKLGQVDVELRNDGSVVLRGETRLAGSSLENGSRRRECCAPRSNQLAGSACNGLGEPGPSGAHCRAAARPRSRRESRPGPLPMGCGCFFHHRFGNDCGGYVGLPRVTTFKLYRFSNCIGGCATLSAAPASVIQNRSRRIDLQVTWRTLWHLHYRRFPTPPMR